MIDYLKLASLLKQQGGGNPIEGNPLDQFLPQDENSRALVDQVLEDKGSSRMGERRKEAMGEALEIAANPILGSYKKIKGDIDEVKGFAKDNLSMMGGMAGTLLMSQALENINGQFERQRNNEAYKRNLAQKSYDPLAMFQDGGKVELFQNGKPVKNQDPQPVPPKKEGYDKTDPRTWTTSGMLKAAGVDTWMVDEDYGDEYLDWFYNYREDFNDNAYKQDEVGEEFYARIFNFGVDRVASKIDAIYGREYGYGSGDKIKNLLRLTLANENSYGQKTNSGPIEGRGYTDGYISADEGGHFYTIANNMAKYADRTEAEADKLNDVTKTYWYAAQLAKSLGIDPKDTEGITERMKKGDPIASMMVVAAQAFRNIENPSKGSSKYSDDVKSAIKEPRDISKESWKKMKADDIEGLSHHWLSGWNGYGNLKYRDYDINKAIAESVKSYEDTKKLGLFEVGADEAFPGANMGQKGKGDMAEEPTKFTNTNGYPVDENEIKVDTATPINNLVSKDYMSAIDTMRSMNEEQKKKSYIDKTGKVVSYRRGGKVYKGVIVGYKDGKPIIKKR